MNKRFSIGLFTGALALTALTACGHTHTSADNWSFDITNHWHACQCGEAINPESHTFLDNLCSTCGSEIVIQEDGTAELSYYDEYGHCILSVSYAEEDDGDWIEELREEYEVNAKGAILRSKSFKSGFLYQEVQYMMGSGGEVTGYITTEYWEDDSKVIYEYNANHELLRKTAYDPAGNEIS